MGALGKVLAVGVVAVVLSMVGVPTAAAAPAAPAAGCDAVVVDGARILGDGRSVARAAAALAKHHATVRVRTWSSVPGGDLDAAVAAEVSRCASWHDRRGHRRADLVVLAVTLRDRHTGVYYGSGWTAALDDHQEEVQTGTVNPLLRRGRYAAAVAGGLAALDRLLPARPGGELAPGSASGDGNGADPADVPPPTGIDLSDGESVGPPGGAVFGVIAVLGILVVVGSTILGVAGRRTGSGRRSRAWSDGNGYAGGVGVGSDSRFSGSSGFSGGSDAGSSSSSSSSDGGGGSTSW